jgi:hypothetical protein
MVTANLLEQIVDEVAAAVAARVIQTLTAGTVVETRPVSEWRLLTTEQVGERLNRSTRWVRERAKAGELPWVRLDSGPLAFRLATFRTLKAAEGSSRRRDK